jgi:hypothetical protein
MDWKAFGELSGLEGHGLQAFQRDVARLSVEEVSQLLALIGHADVATDKVRLGS